MSNIEENKAYSFPISKHIEQDTIISLDGFVHLSGKLPPIPLQFYQISLGDNENNDSTQLVKEVIDQRLLDKPKKITE